LEINKLNLVVIIRPYPVTAIWNIVGAEAHFLCLKWTTTKNTRRQCTPAHKTIRQYSQGHSRSFSGHCWRSNATACCLQYIVCA